MNEDYTPKAVTTTIAATSRASVKIQDSFYTVEYHEERTIPQIDDVNLSAEREALWNTVNSECDNQIEEIIKTFRR